MNEYETEEQQVEALKKWWKENGSSLIFGLVIGVSGLFGYRYYNDMQHQHAMQASDLYMGIVQAVAAQKDVEKSADMNNTLINEFSDTPYAALSSLVLARSEYMKGNREAAVAQLELALKHATDDVIANQARFRLASVYIESGDFDAASALLEVEHDSAYDARYAELSGDLFAARGETDKARAEYDKALALQAESASQWLRLKRDNLGIIGNNDPAGGPAGGSADAPAGGSADDGAGQGAS